MKVTDELRARFLRTRELTEALVAPLSDADSSVQAMADASPSKWHLAHTTWFFETFVLRAFVPQYEVYSPKFHFLFNSYYEAEGPRLARPMRGVLTRPSLDEIRSYRAYVTSEVKLAFANLPEEALKVVEVGCHHEEQHQELLQTDILYLFSQNPLAPAAWSSPKWGETGFEGVALEWIPGKVGLAEIGHAGATFAFDCETPRHKTWLEAHALSNRLVTNAEWREFVQDGGYTKPGLWLSDGWAWVRQNSIEAPLHWGLDDAGEWTTQFGLDGLTNLEAEAPVCHVSYFEAEAFARWAGARLPTEAEWESAAASIDSTKGNSLDAAGAVSPRPAKPAPGLQQMFGDVWQWTASAFLPYPGFQPAPGAIGEYNGKFMSGQFVLRGGSCATPRGHSRATYRNFFYPHQRWQYTGVRLAKDL